MVRKIFKMSKLDKYSNFWRPCNSLLFMSSHVDNIAIEKQGVCCAWFSYYIFQICMCSLLIVFESLLMYILNYYLCIYMKLYARIEIER